jgi:hypothetical protein
VSVSNDRLQAVDQIADQLMQTTAHSDQLALSSAASRRSPNPLLDRRRSEASHHGCGGVEIVVSNAPPCGAGEPGVVPAAAAVANAIFAAAARRLRSLPLALVEAVGERRVSTVLLRAEA